jgi:Arc/MetJ-type ribon-helix-helix transcriptional regulator
MTDFDTMKHRICISVDEQTLVKVREGIRNGRFQNRSHAFEFAVKQVIK